MRAVLADISTQRYLLTAIAQKLPRGAGKSVGWGPGGILRLTEDATEPKLPQAPGWVRLRPELSAICGSDVGLAHAKLSTVLSAYYTESRQIPGHEIVAVVDRVGPGVKRVKEGDRVVVDVVISCVQRGCDPGPALGPCRRRGAGNPGRRPDPATAHDEDPHPRAGGRPSRRLCRISRHHRLRNSPPTAQGDAGARRHGGPTGSRLVAGVEARADDPGDHRPRPRAETRREAHDRAGGRVARRPLLPRRRHGHPRVRPQRMEDCDRDRIERPGSISGQGGDATE